MLIKIIGYYPHRAHSAESRGHPADMRGHSFESRLEVARPKRVLTPPLSPSHSTEHISGNFARKELEMGLLKYLQSRLESGRGIQYQSLTKL